MTDNEKDTGLPEERPQPASAQNDTAPGTAADADIPAAEETAAPEETPNTEEAPKAEKPSEPAEAGKEKTAPEAETPKEETPKEEAPETAESAGEDKPAAETPKTAPAAEKKAESTKADGLGGVGLAISLCDAVLYSVGRDHFHGGIRPDNISVRGDKAYLGGTLQHTVGEFTPQELEYMAPELFWDGIRTPTADVYSIGLILYSLYNYGRLPFWPVSGAITPNARASALQKRMSNEEIQPPASADAELAGIILRALAFRIEERWHDAQELKDALGGCDAAGSAVDISLAMSGLLMRSADAPAIDRRDGQGRGRTYYDDGEIPAGRRPQRRKSFRWLWALLAAIVVVGAVVAAYASGTANNKEPQVQVTPTPEPTQIPTPTPTATPDPTPSPTPKGPRYVVYAENVSWTQAQQRCEELGGTLAVPMTEDEYNEIVRVCTSAKCNYVWLGAERQADGNWRDTNGEIITFFRWDEGEPSGIDIGDNAPENFLMMWRREDGWYYNDSRENPLLDFYAFYGDNVGFVCQMW